MKNILQEYDEKLVLYKAFELKMQHLLNDLLDAQNLKVHSVSTRVKERVSLEKKISLKKKYNNIQEVTDIVGLRIVTFFEDEVDLVADIISKEFDIDTSNSIDKRVIEYDKFGYSSLHYIVSLNSSRNNLAEYKSCKNLKFEIQIRSILQHAWAEIEHDIGYKSKGSIPEIVKRNFSRVAALLETSDLEFTKLRIKLTEYEQDVENEISQHPDSVDLNDISLKSFYENDSIIKEIDAEINRVTGIKVVSELDKTDIFKLKHVGIDNIQELSRLLHERKDHIIEFAKIFLSSKYDKDTYVYAGISLFYLCYVLISEKSESEIETYIKSFWKDDKPDLVKRIQAGHKLIQAK